MFDIGIIGELWSNDRVFAEHLARAGLKPSVATRRRAPVPRDAEIAPGFHRCWDPSEEVDCLTPYSLWRWARACKVVLSFTGALAFGLRELWPLRSLLGLPPVVNFWTGSDILEAVRQQSRHQRLYRQILRFGSLNWCPPYPRAIENLVQLRADRVVFLDYPFALPQSGPELPEPERPVQESDHPLVFLHPSHLDWGINDPAAGRYSTKGNDRFIRAFARAVKSGLHAQCLVVSRGPDVRPAQALVAECGLTEHVQWLPSLTRGELFRRYAQADVVVDQFDVGGLGGIAIEAMAMGKPVLTFVDEQAARLQYDDPPPVLNCRTEDEICDRIMGCNDGAFLRELGQRARSWATRHHDWGHCLHRFLFWHATLTGDAEPLKRYATLTGSMRPDPLPPTRKVGG